LSHIGIIFIIIFQVLRRRNSFQFSPNRLLLSYFKCWEEEILLILSTKVHYYISSVELKKFFSIYRPRFIIIFQVLSWRNSSHLIDQGSLLYFKCWEEEILLILSTKVHYYISSVEKKKFFSSYRLRFIIIFQVLSWRNSSQFSPLNRCCSSLVSTYLLLIEYWVLSV
jgi:hypothetical protein